MGNKLSQADIEQREKFISSICQMNFDKLDIGDRVGMTEYIDFIKPEELVNSCGIVKGVDCQSRKFFVFKVRLFFLDGAHFDTFSTFFQRYDYNNLIWHCCGHHGTYLMDTQGGANNAQFEFLEKLFKEQKVLLNKDKCLDLSILFSNTFTLDEIPAEKYPVEAQIINY